MALISVLFAFSLNYSSASLRLCVRFFRKPILFYYKKLFWIYRAMLWDKTETLRRKAPFIEIQKLF